MPLVEGIDESTGSGLLQTHLYGMKDVLVGYRHGELVSTDENGQRSIDIQRLNTVQATAGTN